MLNNKPSSTFPAATYQSEDGIDKGESRQFITGYFEKVKEADEFKRA